MARGGLSRASAIARSLGDGDLMIDQLDGFSRADVRRLVGTPNRGTVATLKNTEKAARQLRRRLQGLIS